MSRDHVRIGAISIAVILLAGCSQLLRPSDPNLSLLRFSESSPMGWDISSLDRTVDGQTLGFFTYRAEVVPGLHTIGLSWKMTWEEDGEKDTAIIPLQSKRGTCEATIKVDAGKGYDITVEGESSGTWFSDPRINLVVAESGTGREIGRRSCTYLGRRLDLGIH